MNADQAWQSAIGQLQMEMPKASFDTWVRDARLVSYEDGLFTIGVRNAYAREWLESRLTSTVSRMLLGIMNREVGVEFVVADDNTAEPEDNESVAESVAETEDANADVVEIRAEDYDSAYEQIVHPDRAVYLPGYFRRWLRVLGHDLGWMYPGFRQAAYNTGARRGRRQARFSGKEISALCGIAERTFWNRLGNSGMMGKLAGLVNVIETKPEWQPGERLRRMPRQYSVAMTLPLTPADARSLCHWLREHIKQYGGPAGVLSAAAEAPLDSLLPLGADGDGSEPSTVRHIIHDLFAGDLPDEKLDALASAIQTHIMPPNDLIVISHFFIEHILPHMGAGPAWMLTLLRDRCYVNFKTGEKRTQVTVQGGYAEIADWLGMTGGRRALTIYEWLHSKHSKSAKEPGKFKEPVLRAYIRDAVSSRARGNFDDTPRTFDVLLDDIPHEIIELALAEKDIDAIFSIKNRDIYATFSIGFTRLAEDNYATCSIAFTRFAEDNYATCRVFKLLNSLNQTLNSKEPPPPFPPSSKNGVVVGDSTWDLNLLMRNNGVSLLSQEHLRTAGASGEAFAAWLLHGYGPAGKQLRDPVSITIKRLLESPNGGPGGACNTLASLRPSELKALIERDLDYDHPVQQAGYSAVFGEMPAERKRELYHRLFGERPQ
jgi:hypothetical protein